MKEKFADFEGAKYLDQAGEFVFTIDNAELTESKSGNTMVVFSVNSEAGSTKIYHSLSPKARWSYNNLIKACLHLNTREKIQNFECDYELIHNELLGKKFVGVVEVETYEKEVKIPLDDGTFENGTEVKESYKIKDYKEVTKK